MRNLHGKITRNLNSGRIYLSSTTSLNYKGANHSRLKLKKRKIMKTVFKLLTSYFLLLTSLSATPTWYYNIPNTKQNFYIGYGSGISEKEAKQNALIDISSKIKTKIDNTTTIDKKLTDGNYQKDIQTKSIQETQASISDYKILKMNYEDNRYFVAIEYENIASIEKFKRKLKKHNIELQFDNYLKTFELLRKNKQWYIKYKDIQQLLDKKDFARFFQTIPNKELSITTNKKNNILYENDEFYFKIYSKQKGYVSILTVYEDGTVSTLLKNIPIDSNKTTNLPDKDFEAIPEASLLQSGVETFDMYVAIYSAKKILFDRFASADDEIIDDEKYKNFDELLYFLKNKKYTTLKVVTKPR